MNPEEQAHTSVIVFGTFDVFHLGHEYFLKKAKALGDFLTVVIARDKTVKNVKGEYPQHNEKQRMENVKNSGIPDKVVLGNFDDKYKIIRKIKPNIIALGYDQFVFTYKLNKMIIDEKMDTEIIRLESYEPNLYKSSFIKSANEENNE
jgi:FAD synthetase